MTMEKCICIYRVQCFAFFKTPDTAKIDQITLFDIDGIILKSQVERAGIMTILYPKT